MGSSLSHDDNEKLEHIEIINGRKVLKKHVAAIHCSNKLSLIERKISNALLYHALPNLTHETIHEILISDLSVLLGFNSNNTRHLKTALKRLISTVIEWNLLGDPGVDVDEGWNASSMLASVRFKKGVCYYQYSESLKKLLADPSIYGRVNLIIQARFKSAYGLALYENCVRYRGLPNTKNFDITLFRELMGVKEGQYSAFKDFKKRVLNPAVEEVNLHSDIMIEPILKRKGRQVVSIMFKLSERPIMKRLGYSQKITSYEKADCFLVECLESNIGLSKEKIASLIVEYGEDNLKKTYDYVTNLRSFQKGGILNLAGYFISALKGQYKNVSSDEVVKRQNKIKHDMNLRKKRILEEHVEIVKQQEKEKFMSSQYKITYINQVLNKLDDDEKKEVIDIVLVNLRSTPLIGKKIAEDFEKTQLVDQRSLHMFEKILSERCLLNELTKEQQQEN